MRWVKPGALCRRIPPKEMRGDPCLCPGTVGPQGTVGPWRYCYLQTEISLPARVLPHLQKDERGRRHKQKESSMSPNQALLPALSSKDLWLPLQKLPMSWFYLNEMPAVAFPAQP